MCVSLVVLHVLWDMASSQVKAVNNIDTIDLFNADNDFMESEKFTR